MCTITEQEPKITTKDMLVSKFIEVIGGKKLSSPRGYNYDDHDPEDEGQYYSYQENDPRGNAIFLIPAGSEIRFDEHQNIIQSNKIKFVKFKN